MSGSRVLFRFSRSEDWLKAMGQLITVTKSCTSDEIWENHFKMILLLLLETMRDDDVSCLEMCRNNHFSFDTILLRFVAVFYNHKFLFQCIYVMFLSSIEIHIYISPC